MAKDKKKDKPEVVGRRKVKARELRATRSTAGRQKVRARDLR